MAGRGPISEFVGDIPIVNTSYSGDLTQMSEDGLRATLRVLVAAGLDDDDESDEAFENRQAEISAVRQELEHRSRPK